MRANYPTSQTGTKFSGTIGGDLHYALNQLWICRLHNPRVGTFMAEVDHEKLMRPVGNGRAPLLGASDVTPCEEKIRLTTEYQTATEIFSKAVTELHEKMGTSSQEEYERLQHASEEWRVHSEQARLALEQHIAAHRC